MGRCAPTTDKDSKQVGGAFIARRGTDEIRSGTYTGDGEDDEEHMEDDVIFDKQSVIVKPNSEKLPKYM